MSQGNRNTIVFATPSQDGSFTYYHNCSVSEDYTKMICTDDSNKETAVDLYCNNTDDFEAMNCVPFRKDHPLLIAPMLKEHQLIFKFDGTQDVIDLTDDNRLNSVKEKLYESRPDRVLTIIVEYKEPVNGRMSEVLQFNGNMRAKVLIWLRHNESNIKSKKILLVEPAKKDETNFVIEFSENESGQMRKLIASPQYFVIAAKGDGETAKDGDLKVLEIFRSREELQTYLDANSGVSDKKLYMLHVQNFATNGTQAKLLTTNKWKDLKTYAAWVAETEKETVSVEEKYTIPHGGSKQKIRLNFGLATDWLTWKEPWKYQEENAARNLPDEANTDYQKAIDEQRFVDRGMGYVDDLGLEVRGAWYPWNSFVGISPYFNWGSDRSRHIMAAGGRLVVDPLGFVRKGSPVDFTIFGGLNWFGLRGEGGAAQAYSTRHKYEMDAFGWDAGLEFMVRLKSFGDSGWGLYGTTALSYGETIAGDTLAPVHGDNRGEFGRLLWTLGLNVSKQKGYEEEATRTKDENNPWHIARTERERDIGPSYWENQPLEMPVFAEGAQPNKYGFTNDDRKKIPEKAHDTALGDTNFEPGSAFLVTIPAKDDPNVRVNPAIMKVVDRFQNRKAFADKYGLTYTVAGRVDAFADPFMAHHTLNLPLTQDRASGMIPEKCTGPDGKETACTYTAESREDKRPKVDEKPDEAVKPGFRSNLVVELKRRGLVEDGFSDENIKAVGHGEDGMIAYECGATKESCEETIRLVETGKAGEKKVLIAYVKGDNDENVVLLGQRDDINIKSSSSTEKGTSLGRHSLLLPAKYRQYGWDRSKEVLDAFKYAKPGDVGHFSANGVHYLVELSVLKNLSDPDMPMIRGQIRLPVYDCGKNSTNVTKVTKKLDEGVLVPTVGLVIPEGVEIHLCKGSGSSKGNKGFKVDGKGVFTKRLVETKSLDSDTYSKARYFMTSIKRDGGTVFYLVDLPGSRRVETKLDIIFDELRVEDFYGGDDLKTEVKKVDFDHDGVKAELYRYTFKEGFGGKGETPIKDFDKKILGSMFREYGRRSHGKELVVFINLNAVTHNEEDADKIAAWIGLMAQEYARVPVRVFTSLSDKYPNNSIVLMNCKKNDNLFTGGVKPRTEQLISARREAIARGVFVTEPAASAGVVETDKVKAYSFDLDGRLDGKNGLTPDAEKNVAEIILGAEDRSNEVVVLVCTRAGVEDKTLSDQLNILAGAHTLKNVRIKFSSDSRYVKDQILILTGDNVDTLFTGDSFEEKGSEGEFLRQLIDVKKKP